MSEPTEELNAQQFINLIYETADDNALWPKLIEACEAELQTLMQDASSSTSSDHTEHALANHLQHAMRMNRKIDALQSEIGATRHVLDALPIGVITIDREFKVIDCNAIAERTMQSAPVLSMSDGVLCCLCIEHEARFKTLIDDAFALNLQSERKHSAKFQISNEITALSVCAVATQYEHTSLCTLFLVSNTRQGNVSPDQLQLAFDLTPAESRVASLLVNGESISTASAKLKVSQNTVRNQLKSIFAKTGVRRQSELVALVLSKNIDSGIEDSTNYGVPLGKAKDKPEFESFIRHITLSDGRNMSYLEFGDKNGIPIIYHHDIVLWNWWQIVGVDAFEKLGTRMIMPIRAGFLSSDGRRDKPLGSFAQDVKELLQRLNIVDFYALGFSSGGPFAIATAHALPGQCKGLALCSSMGPIKSLSELDNTQPPMSKLVLGFAKYTPRLYRGFFNSLLKTVFANTLDYINDYVNHWSAYDKQLMENPVYLQSLSRSFRSVLLAGREGLVDESVIITRNWGLELADITVPCVLWRGADDRAISRSVSNKLANIPGLTIHDLQGKGHLHIIDTWQNVLTELVKVESCQAENKQAYKV